MFSSLVNGAFNIGQQTAANEFSRESQDKAIQANKESQERGIEANRREAELAYLRSLSFYQQYNSPAAMVKQMKEAGLSVGMMYGNGAGGAQGHGAIESPAPGNGGLSNPSAAGMAIGTSGEMSLADIALARKTNAEADVIEQYGSREKEAEINLMQAKSETENTAAELNTAIKGRTEEETQWQAWQKKIAEIDQKIKAASEEDLIAFNREKVNELQAMIEWYDQQVIESKENVKNETKLKNTLGFYYYQQAKLAFAEAESKFVQNKQQRDIYEAVVATAWNTAREVAAQADNEEQFMERFDSEMKQRRRDNWFELGESGLRTVGDITTSYLTGKFKMKALSGAMVPTYQQTTTTRNGNRTTTQSWTRRGM